jgi:hypothetical protein
MRSAVHFECGEMKNATTCCDVKTLQHAVMQVDTDHTELFSQASALTALSLLLLLPPTAVFAALGQSRSRPADSCRSWWAVKSKKRRETATRAPRTICKPHAQVTHVRL